MLNSHFGIKLLVWLIIFTLPALACGTADTTRNRVSLPDGTSTIAETSTEVKYTVTADTLNVRTGAGTDFPVIVGLELHKGETVTCLEMSGKWCRHWQGWSHTGWMK
jgi:uncharacterized protein YgiM (DUF1202 family)